MKISELKRLGPATWFLIIGTLVTKASYFISMPYLAVRLKETLGLDPILIGVALGAGPAVGIIAGFYVGYLSDNIGRKQILIWAILLSGLTFFGFALASEFWHYVLLNTVLGLASSAHHPVSSALLSDLTDLELRKPVFHLRYFAINLGATFGPLGGAWLLLHDPAFGFYITGVVYLLFAIASAFYLPPDAVLPASAPAGRVTFSETMKAVLEDKPLMLYTFAFILMGLTYSQLESTLPQYLHNELSEEGVKLYGLLWGLNAAFVVIFQIPLTRLTGGLPLIPTIMIGSVLYGIGFMLFGAAGTDRWGLIAAMLILTFGEILIFSNGNLVIDRIAPPDKKGVYFGASGLWGLGATLGPSFGGYILMKTSGPTLFYLLGGLAVANAALYRLGSRFERHN